MRLIVDQSLESDRRLISGFEETTLRLREALSVLDLIEAGEMLAELPLGSARNRHQQAVSLLAIMRREIVAIVESQSRQIESAAGARWSPFRDGGPGN